MQNLMCPTSWRSRSRGAQVDNPSHPQADADLVAGVKWTPGVGVLATKAWLMILGATLQFHRLHGTLVRRTSQVEWDREDTSRKARTIALGCP
eukprot:4934845-Amphidinium_carterae.1